MVLLPSVAQQRGARAAASPSAVAVAGAGGRSFRGRSRGLFWGGEWVLQLLFGDQYLGVAPLLWLYALATTLFALANVFITYDLSLGRRSGSWLALLAGCVQIAAIMLFHDTLAQVVTVQIAVMLALVAVLAVQAWWSASRRNPT